MASESPLVPMGSVKTETKGLNEKNNGHATPPSEKSNCCRVSKAWKFIILFLLYEFVHGVNSTYLFSILTTLERRYNLPSSMSGLLSSVSTVGYVIAVLVVSYFGRGRNLSKLFAIFSLVTILCGVIYVLPHFIFKSASDALSSSNANQSTSSGQNGLEVTQYCTLNGTLSNVDCLDSNGSAISPVTAAFIMFVASEILSGITGAPILALGIPFVDNALNRKTASKMIGIIYGLRFFSPPIAFLFGTAFLRFHHSLQEVEISPDSPQWIGAWYLGYFVFASAMLAVSLMFFFIPGDVRIMAVDDVKKKSETIEVPENTVSPRRRLDFENLNGNNLKQSNIQSEKNVDDEDEDEVEEGAVYSDLSNFRELPTVFKRLVKNPVYMFTILGFNSDVLMFGFIIFIPKYLEVQFHMETTTANLLGGVLSWTSSGLASIVSGILASKLKRNNVKYMSLMTWTCCGLSVILYLLLMTFDCETTHVNSQELSCGIGCGCSSDIISPICGSDGETYLSPCHAGCQLPSNASEALSGCTCIGDGSATVGQCQPSCKGQLIGYILLLYLTLFVSNIYNVPATNTILRSVRKEDKPIALGILSFLMAFGVFPAPMMFGGLMDYSCVYEKPDPCGDAISGQGACLFYSSKQYRVNHHLLIASLRLLSTILYLIPWVLTVFKKSDSKVTDRKA